MSAKANTKHSNQLVGTIMPSPFTQLKAMEMYPKRDPHYINTNTIVTLIHNREERSTRLKAIPYTVHIFEKVHCRIDPPTCVFVGDCFTTAPPDSNNNDGQPLQYHGTVL